MNEAEWGDWIDWAGGECPLGDGVGHQIKLRGGEVQGDDAPASWRWSPAARGHIHNPDFDIVAYRTKRKTIALPVKDMAGDKHSHYFKDVSKLDRLDVYRLLALFDVTDPALQHIIKKARCAGKRGAKDFAKDVREIADTANRRVQMLVEDGL